MQLTEVVACGLPKAEVEQIIRDDLKSFEEERNARENRKDNAMVFEMEKQKRQF